LEVIEADNRYGRSRLEGFVSIGVIVHSESTVAGHGPGVVSLMSAPKDLLQPVLDRDANIARYLNIRTPRSPRALLPLALREQREADHNRSQQHRERPRVFA